MNKRQFTLLNVLFFFSLSVFSQDWESVKSSSLYVYGEGWGATVAEADKQALNDLISKISVRVVGDVSHEETETVTNAGVVGNSTFSILVKTYSQATLNNANKVVLKNEPNAHVGRWIKVSEIDKIFEGRKNKIKDYVTSAIKAQKQGKIDVALKDYYWALSLVNSLRYPNEMVYETEDGEKLLLITWIPRQIKELFSDIKPIVTKRDGDEVELFITYQGKPVSSIDYTYFDGRDWGNIYSAKDGVGVLELAPGNQSEYIQLKFEYEYRGQSQIDADVENVLNSSPATVMPNAYFNIKNKEKSLPKSTQNNNLSNSFSNISAEIYSKPTALADVDKYQGVVDKIVKAITTKKHEDLEPLFTAEGLDIYQRLIKYGNAKIVGKTNVEAYQYNDYNVVRGLQMSFSFKNGLRKSFVEDVVLYMNREGKIDNITFGLGKTAENDILCKGVWSESARFAIMNFLENYKTAYALKRLDYITTIFDDDAVIITGKVVKVSTKGNGQKTNEIIKYNRYTKDSYLKYLKNSFASKEYINLRFADNDVRKLGKGGEIYSIQISQEYYSSNYGDKGYLFLMVDINNPDEPIIKVRTWQPEKDPDFGIYGPEDFK